MFRSIDLSIYLCIYLSVCLSACLSVYLSTCVSASLKNQAILRDILIFRSWQYQKRSNSARLLHFLNLTTSKTKLFCETSSIFEFDNIKNKAIRRDFLQKSKVECSADGLVPMFFFHSTLSKVLRLPRKIDARSYEVLHLSRKIILANLQVWCSKMQSLSGNQRPDLLTSLMNMSFVVRLPREMHLCRSASNVPRMPSFFGNATIPSCFAHFWEGAQSLAPATRKHIWTVPVSFLHFWLRNVLRATTACTFSTSQLLKVVRSWCVLYILISKCSSRHNGVHFIALFSTSQLLKMDRSWCVLYKFHFEMCFAPQRRAIFHLSSG